MCSLRLSLSSRSLEESSDQDIFGKCIAIVKEKKKRTKREREREKENLPSSPSCDTLVECHRQSRERTEGFYRKRTTWQKNSSMSMFLCARTTIISFVYVFDNNGRNLFARYGGDSCNNGESLTFVRSLHSKGLSTVLLRDEKENHVIVNKIVKWTNGEISNSTLLTLLEGALFIYLKPKKTTTT
ncbi:hypothetical protein V1477_016787 [Vespula maculifrons]|uniref:Uncharacterized protein n=1 Tax=Vespula maculifrons TaxID=7453 RepID=A0ABD2B472_VESMC